MAVPRERLVQLARLIGFDAFRVRFGAPQTAEPPSEELAALMAERVAEIGRGLVEEAVASDDVIDAASAAAYLNDRLRTFGDLLTAELEASIREAFREGTAGW